MHPHHVAARLLRSLTRRSSLLRYFSLLAIPLLVFAWIYAIRKGERRTFKEHIDACAWSSWEDWPADATPHRLVFIADPQIVDPHTYPGRPWPLSSLTERYTDRYMRRNYQLINEKLDPDSLVFLGDLFDGGREWTTHTPRALSPSQRRKLERIKAKNEKEKQQAAESQKQSEDGGNTNAGAEQGQQKRSVALDDAIGQTQETAHIARRSIQAREVDPKEFVAGENGRWKSWGMKQWMKEYDRFGRMFFAPEQLYPNTQRRTIPAWDVDAHPLNVENGAMDVTREEHAVIGGKARRLLTSLPGNHDVGFGAGVQLSVRNRFNVHFGESNRVDVLGNHSIVSIDAPSLAAYSQFEISGETPPQLAESRKHIWKPAMDFLDDVQYFAAKSVADTMADYFPDRNYDFGRKPSLEVTDTESSMSKRSLEKSRFKLPVVLLSHVPLYRDPGTDCGPLRERGRAISISGGYQYQNVLTRGLSNTVAQKVSNAGDIAHIFSGDDHDYCDVLHRYNVGSMGEKRSPKLSNVPETTVKSFSWAMGVRRPGFQLLSLWNPVDANGGSIGGSAATAQTHLCLLPDQIGILINYGKLAGFTVIVLLVRAIMISLRGDAMYESGEESDTLSELSLPRFRNQGTPNGSANGYSTPDKGEVKGRQRASSTGLKPMTDNQNLGVQRSYNARTRSVSPAPGYNYPLPPGGLPNVPMFDKGSLYPHASDDSDDEESHIGDFDDDKTDSQAKWKRKRRGSNRARVAFDEFVKSLGIVAGCGIVVYLHGIWSW
ncbi:hypothetical protein WHR41_05045 [Cladosporium halotolerans]|uniref:Calcineurin-like phosphoesterase domain-containing protein n=1 Tax=Cladosporium halotolerans TaxID=1052096 RepID=A0AB34KM38_9PEZI